MGLFFSGDDKPNEKDAWRSTYQEKDSLSPYILKLYELTDDDPFYFSNKADSLLSTLWRQPATSDEQINYLDFILNIAYHLLQQGQIPASCRWYEKGLNYQQDNKLNNYEAEEYIYKPLGNNYVRLGDYDKAVAIQEKAIEQTVANNKKELLSSLYSNLAISYFWLKNYEAVQMNCNKGFYYLLPNNPVKGLLYNVKADAFYEAEKKDSALFYNEKALQFFQSPNAVEADAGWPVSTLQLSAKLLSSQKKYAAAIVKLQNAEKILEQFFPNSRQRDKAKLLLEKGNLFLKLNNIDSAHNSFTKGSSYFQMNKNGFFPDHTISSLYFGLAQCFEQTNTDSSIHYYQLTVANDYYANQLITSSYNSLTELVNDKQLTNKAIAFIEQQFKRTSREQYLKQMLWMIELSKGRKLLNEVQRSNQWQQDSTGATRKQLFSELRYDYLLLAQTNDSIKKKTIEQRIRLQELELGLQEQRFGQLLKEPNFEEFQNAISLLLRKSCIISYYVLKDSLITIVAEANKINYYKLSTAAIEKELRQFVQTYFTAGSYEFNNNPAAYYKIANQLYQQLLQNNTNVVNKLIISADAFVHLLPFEALVVNKQQFLGAEKEISYSYSLLQYLNHSKEKVQALPVTVFTFNQNHLNFPALPNSKTEADFIQKNFSSTVANAAETPADDFLKAIQQTSVLHIATHAVADDSLQQPYFVLQNKVYLGQLQYTTTSAPLVVLTACETAAGNLQKGEGVVSLARVLISKGVKGIVASRWKVDDAVAPVFVKEFYKQMSEKHSPSAALFAARKKYLQTAGNLSAKNPMLWAGFSYVGVEQELELKKAGGLNWWWLLIFIPVVYFVLSKRL